MRTVLLAESHLPTLRHLAELLSQAGYQVHAATEPGAALELFAAYRPEVVLVSVHLAPLDSESLALRIRKTENGARLPLIALDHGHLGKLQGVNGILDWKANAYVADPLKPGELLPKISQLLELAPGSLEDTSKSSVLLGRAPLHRGELKLLTLPEVAYTLYRESTSGILVSAHREVIRRLFWLDGKVVHFDSNLVEEGLPQFLEDEGLLSKAQLKKVIGLLGSGTAFVATLQEAGLELTGDSLRQVIQRYLMDRAAKLFGSREGRYAFFSGDELRSSMAPLEIPTLGAVLAGVRMTFPVRVFADKLRPHLGQFPVRTDAFAGALPALGLSPDDLKLAMQINGRILLRELLAHGRDDLRANTSLFWMLTLAGAVRFEPHPVGAAERAEGAEGELLLPRKRRKPLPPHAVAELRETAMGIITGSCYRGLSLPITASAEEVERAYQVIAARFHEDSYPLHDTEELQDLFEAVQDRLGACYRVLLSDDKRRSYLERMLSRGSRSRSSAPNVDAELAVHLGDQALKAGDLGTALQQFERAVALNPKEAEYYPRLAWVVFRSEEGTMGERIKVANKWLKKAFASTANLERAHVVAAILKNEAGQASAARKRLVQVLQRNPQSILAKAALRRVGR